MDLNDICIQADVSEDVQSNKETISVKDKYDILKGYAEFVGNSVGYCRFNKKNGNIDPVLYFNYKTDEEKTSIEEKIKMFYQEKNIESFRMPLFKADEERSNFTIWINKTRNEVPIGLKRLLIEYIVTDPKVKDETTGVVKYSYEDYQLQLELNVRVQQIVDEIEW